MACVYCNVYGLATKPDRIKLNGFSLNETIGCLKSEISKQTTIPTEELAVLYCGRSLSDYDTLESCGVKHGRTLHLLRRPSRANPVLSHEKIDSSELGLQRLVMALKTAFRNPAYRSTVQRLSKPEVLENIIAATPGLSEDPIAIAILQDPDLLMQFTDVATIHRVVETHPALAEAINHIVAAVHEDSTTQRGANQLASSAFPGAYSYLLDALSDDDDEAESPGSLQESVNQSRGTGEQTQSPFPAITPAQLASALAAVATAGSSSSSSSVGLSTPQASSSMETGESGPVPSPRILWDRSGPFGAGPSGASGSSIQPTLVPTTSTGTGGAAAAAAFSPEFVGLAMRQALGAASMNQLQQLRDMGIMDDAVSLRALQITGGNVQAALELIFGDATGNFGQSPF